MNEIGEERGIKGHYKQLLLSPEILKDYRICKINKICDGQIKCGWQVINVNTLEKKFYSLKELGFYLPSNSITFEKIPDTLINKNNMSTKAVSNLHKELLPNMSETFGKSNSLIPYKGFYPKKNKYNKK